MTTNEGKGQPKASSAYRHFNMFDTTDLPEKLIKLTLTDAIRAVWMIKEVVQAVRLAEIHRSHCRQIVLLVTLVIRNAFNSARWCSIVKGPENCFHIPEYLLRILRVDLKNRPLL